MTKRKRKTKAKYKKIKKKKKIAQLAHLFFAFDFVN